jgi:hypothetical protein
VQTEHFVFPEFDLSHPVDPVYFFDLHPVVPPAVVFSFVVLSVVFK